MRMSPFGGMAPGSYDEDERNEADKKRDPSEGYRPSFAVGASGSSMPLNKSEQAEQYAEKYAHTLPKQSSQDAAKAEDVRRAGAKVGDVNRPAYVDENGVSHGDQGKEPSRGSSSSQPRFPGRTESEAGVLSQVRARANERQSGNGRDTLPMEDIARAPRLLTEEVAKKGAGAEATRTTYRRDGSEVTNSFRSENGRIVHTADNGKETTMSLAEAKRFECDQLARVNGNTQKALQEMKDNPGMSCKQGGSTFHVEGDRFIRTDENGKQGSMSVREAERRLAERGQKIEAMRERVSDQGGERRDYRESAARIREGAKEREGEQGQGMEVGG